MKKVLMILKDRYPLSRPDVKVLLARNGRGYGFNFDFLCRAEDGVIARRTERLEESRVIVFPGFFGRGLLNWLLDLWRYSEFVLRILSGIYRVVLVRDEYFSAVLGAVFCFVVRKHFVYWMSFPMYEQYRCAAMDARGVKKIVLHCKFKVAEFLLFKFVLKMASHVFCQSVAMKSVLGAKGVNLNKITPVPMGVDFSMIDSILSEEITALMPQDIPHFCCLTIHSSVRKLDVLLSAVSLLKDKGVLFKLWMIGGEDVPGEIDRLKMVADKLGLGDSVEFIGLLNQCDAFRLVRGCSIGISVIPHGPLFDVSSPTKIVEYIALGVPVVGSDLPDQVDVIEKTKFGHVVRFDPESIALGLRDLLNKISGFDDRAASAFSIVKEERDYQVLSGIVFYEIKKIIEG